jgi:hypothetical protein
MFWFLIFQLCRAEAKDWSCRLQNIAAELRSRFIGLSTADSGN